LRKCRTEALLYDDAVIRKLYDLAKKWRESPATPAPMPAGVVISKEPLNKYVPLSKVSKGNGEGGAMVQFPMEDVGAHRFVEMDFLGLVNLNILGKAKQIIKERTTSISNLHTIPLDDAKTYQLLASGDTGGCFSNWKASGSAAHQGAETKHLPRKSRLTGWRMTARGHGTKFRRRILKPSTDWSRYVPSSRSSAFLE